MNGAVNSESGVRIADGVLMCVLFLFAFSFEYIPWAGAPCEVTDKV